MNQNGLDPYSTILFNFSGEVRKGGEADRKVNNSLDTVQSLA